MGRDAVAILQFLQDRTVFGSKSRFSVEIYGKNKITIDGGIVSRISLYELGSVTLRAEIDGYTSAWTKVPIGPGEIINLIILPPKSPEERLSRLSSPDGYLSIEEINRV